MTNKIKEVRKAQGFTQEDLSGEIDVSPTRMSHIETGKIEASEEEWEKLADVLGKNVAFLRFSSTDRYGMEHEGRNFLFKKLMYALDDLGDSGTNTETFLACQQIIENPMLLDTIRLVLSGGFSDFLDELRQTLKDYEGREEITFQPYNITVTKDMFRYVKGKKSKRFEYAITEGLTWDDYRIDHDCMTMFMREIDDAIESLPEKYRDSII